MAIELSTDHLEPDLDQATRFLTLIGESGNDWTFQTFDDNAERGDRSLARILHTCESGNPVAPKLTELNALGAGIFVMINRGDGLGRKAQNVTGVRAVFVDLDGAPLGGIYDSPLAPHIIVESSLGRYHAYWRIDKLPLEHFSTVQLALAQRFNGDPSVKDLPRVMRVPGFYHQKSTPFRARIIREELVHPYAD